MSSATRRVRSKVIVAVGPAAPDPLALTAAARLARSGDAELATLFVEDINLLRLAELPFSIEIGMVSDTVRRLGVSDVERVMKRQAAELRRELEAMTRAVQLEWTFDMARGRPARVLLEAAGEGDLVVLASAAVRTLAHTALTASLRSALEAMLGEAKSRRVRPVAAALRPGPGALRVLAAAYQFARASDAELVLFYAAAGEDEEAFLSLLNDWLGERAAAARVVPLLELTPENIAQRAAAEDVEALFWPGDGMREIEPEVEALTGAINCPVIVVR